jgi:hypothetical protein
MRTRLRCLQSESGEGLISGLILIAGVLVPLLFLIPLFARLEQARLAAEQTARDSVRAAVQSPNAAAAQAAATHAVERAQTNTKDRIQLRLQGAFVRGGELEATATVQVPLATLPVFGTFGTVTVRGRASAPVDQYRSVISGAP